MALSAAAAVNLVWARLVGHHPDPWTRIFAAHLDPWAYLLFVSQASLVSPIAEETLFQGLLCAGLSQRMPPVLAGIVSATLFGLGHLNPWGLPSYITLGLVLAWVYYRTRNIWASITTHAVINLVILSLHYAAQANHSG